MSLLVGKLVCLLGSYLAGIGLGVLIHEMGHALAALVVTKQQVQVEIGTGGKQARWGMGSRLAFVFHSSGLRYGATRIDYQNESRGTRGTVVASGPLASLIGCSVFGWLASQVGLDSWMGIVCLGLAIANFRILIVAIWPVEYPDPNHSGSVWVSDGLQLWRLLNKNS